jgi:diacylglycerol kinase (ATP)
VTVHLIVNGAAGGGRCAQRAQPFLDRLRDRGVVAEASYTAAPGDATRMAGRIDADVVVAVGGDGTLFEVVNGLFSRSGDRPALGVLPLGTGNSFARDFGLHDPEAALDALSLGRRRACDVVRARHRDGELYYVNLLSIGFTARAGALTNRRFKPLGTSGYILSVLASLIRLEHPTFSLRLDGGALDDRACTLWSFSNSRYTGGDMMMAPDADLSDGLVDCVRIGPLGRRRFLGAFPKIFKGTHPELDEIDVTQVGRVDFELDEEVDVLVDGEILRLQLDSLEVLPDALEFIA